VAAPFYNAIKASAASVPGTGAFTPGTALTGNRAWATVGAGWIGLVRFDDAAAWELSYCYWNGTTLSRAATQLLDSSSGTLLNLSGSSTAAMIVDAADVVPHLGSTALRGWIMGNISGGGSTVLGTPALTVTGTGSAPAVAATNFFTEQIGSVSTSATTANAQAGWSTTTPLIVVNTSAGRGGGEMAFRFGSSALPTGPRLFAGLTSVTFVANTGEPSALQSASVAAFAKDSTDTNIQLLTNDGTATNGTKVDTGIPFAANAWYEASIWIEPGSNKVWGLLIRRDTGAIWLGSTITDVPASGALLFPQLLGGLSSTTGTAILIKCGDLIIRSGS
jgi:hypothetical protein